MLKFGDKDRRWGSSFDWKKSCAIEDGEENGNKQRWTCKVCFQMTSVVSREVRKARLRVDERFLEN